jgi:sugar lactone lactonase YvrE
VQTSAPALDSLAFVGHDLERPESVICTASGDVFVANRRCGATLIRPDGTQVDLGDASLIEREKMCPNGIALLSDRTVLFANIGDSGGIWRIGTDGRTEPYVLDVDGQRLANANFVGLDRAGRLWISVSTRRVPRDEAFNKTVADGYVVLKDERGARIVADGIGFVNEVRVDERGEYLYVSETFHQKISRMRIAPDGALGERETFVSFPPGCIPDGFDFDEEGGLWVTTIVSNVLFWVTPDGRASAFLSDNDPAALAASGKKLDEGRFTRADMNGPSSRVLKNISSIAFGSSDRRTAYLGCLLGSSLATFPLPVAGVEPPHWRY